MTRARVERLVPFARAVFFPLSVAVVAVMAVSAARSLHPAHVTWWLLVPASAATAVWWLLLARAWGVLHSGRATRADVRLWCRTQALRYLPGSIWAPVSRVAATQGGALDRVSTVTAENVAALCAALAIAGACLGAARDVRWLALVAVVAAPAAVAGLTARRTRIDRDRTLRATANDVVAFAAYAAAAVLVQAALSGFRNPGLVAGAAALAWGAGLVVIASPGGVGVRELVYLWLLHGHGFPRSEVVGAAVLFRAVTIAVELVVLLALGRPSRLPANTARGGEDRSIVRTG
jgi:uncharacterized membrane protein YbhN (UPF0104 family)